MRNSHMQESSNDISRSLHASPVSVHTTACRTACRAANFVKTRLSRSAGTSIWKRQW